MTKEEYQDFALRYKGCGACFPMYHTLSRFEKMWFTAIQKDAADLEKENEELRLKLEAQIEKMKNWCNCKNYQQCLIELAEQGKGMKPSECCVNCKKWEVKEND